MEAFVRRADSVDVRALVGLEAELRAAATEQRGGSAWLATRPELADIGWGVRLADPGWLTLVAGIDGVVLAFGMMRMPLGGARAVATVESIFVADGAREVGLGESLLAMFVDAARLAGATEIDATALPGDRNTKNLYERLGLVARLIVVSRRLEQS
jgi:GNAT superfamily N-acetyltransferase